MRRLSFRSRRGNILVLVLFFSIVILIGLFAYWFVLSCETQGTVNVVKEIVATGIGDGVCAQLESMVNRRPWEDRFYFLLAQERGGTDPSRSWGAYYFTHGTFPFGYDQGAYRSGAAKFYGVIKDLDVFSATYRVYVEVIYKGHKVTMSWDKKFEQGLIGALNSDFTAFTKTLETNERVAESTADRFLDVIKEVSRDPAKVLLTAEDVRVLKELAEARGTFNETVELPKDVVQLPETGMLESNILDAAMATKPKPKIDPVIDPLIKIIPGGM